MQPMQMSDSLNREPPEAGESRRWRGVLLFIGTCIFLVMDNPAWEVWKNAYRATEILRTNKLRDPNTIVLENPKSLGGFLYRPHSHTIEKCSSIHQLATDKKIECEGLERTIGSVDSCGGIPLVPGFCVMPEQVSFTYRNTSKSPESFVVSTRVICNNATLADGFFSNYRYHGSNCELEDLNPAWIHERFNGRLIVFVGDSHARNLFSSFVAEVRNQKHLVERHPDVKTKDTLFPYQQYKIFPDRDRLIDLAGSKSLTYDSVRKEGKECSLKSDKSKCPVTVLFLWAGFPSEYESLLKTTLPAIRPDVIVTDFITKAYTTAVGFENSLKVAQSGFEQLFAALSKSRAGLPPVSFSVSPFPLFGGEEVRPFVRNWFEEKATVLAGANVRTHLIDQAELIAAYERTTGKPLEQLKMTSHTVCSLYDTFSLDPKLPVVGGFKIKGFENCITPIDRAVARVAFTFAALEADLLSKKQQGGKKG